jgi:hypothetical protein
MNQARAIGIVHNGSVKPNPQGLDPICRRRLIARLRRFVAEIAKGSSPSKQRATLVGHFLLSELLWLLWVA